MREPHGIWIDTRGAAPNVTVADRAQQPAAAFHAGRRGTSTSSRASGCPCHFHERNGIVVIADLQGRVTLMDRNNRIIEHLGDRHPGIAAEPEPRHPRTARAFVPGQFITPHGANFDHDGNIFVVEWVEIGRVTKLRKVA